MPKFLDEHGLAYLWQQVKSYIDQSSQSTASGWRHLGQGQFDIRECAITPPDEFNPYTKQMLHICLFIATKENQKVELGDISFVYDNTSQTHNMFVCNEKESYEGSIGIAARYIGNQLYITCNERSQDWWKEYPSSDNEYIVADVYWEEFYEGEITTDELLLV